MPETSERRTISLQKPAKGIKLHDVAVACVGFEDCEEAGSTAAAGTSQVATTRTQQRWSPGRVFSLKTIEAASVAAECADSKQFRSGPALSGWQRQSNALFVAQQCEAAEGRSSEPQRPLKTAH